MSTASPPAQPPSSSSSSSSSPANNNANSSTQSSTPPAPLPPLNVSISVGTNTPPPLPSLSPPPPPPPPTPLPSSSPLSPSQQQTPIPLNSSPPPPPSPQGPPTPPSDGNAKGNTTSSPPPSPLPSSPPPPTPSPTPPQPPPTPTFPPPISNQPPPPISSPPLQSPSTDKGPNNKIFPPPPPSSPSSPPPFFPPPPPTLQFSPPLPSSPPFSPPPPALASGPTPVFPPPLPINMIPPSSPPFMTLAPYSSPNSESNQSPLPSPSTNTDVSSSSSSSTPSSSDSSPSNNTVVVGAIAGGTVALAIVALIAVVVFVVLRKRRKTTNDLSSQYKSKSRTLSSKPADNMYYASKPAASSSGLTNTYGSHRVPGYHSVLPESGGSKLWFSYEELKDFTNGFSQENVLGEGGFGCVYKGCLPDGRSVAVKQLKVGGSQGEREFRAEVEIISRVHHRHLVSLVGYCVDEHHRLLVYDYLPNKTLEYHLHGNGLPVLEWSKRVKIAIGSARGLAYLHEDCHPRIIHRDIKSSNILLDNCFEAQVSDFGLAKLSNDSHSHVSTRVMGTFGYMAPEYASSGKLTDRSDVFSFGVVLLEIITGRKPVDSSQPLGDESLVEWARPLLVRALETGEYEEFVDPRLDNKFVRSEMMLMIEAAAACVRHSASKRPRMVQVVRALDNECDLSDLSNGMKFGQSTIYNSAQYSAEIRRFHRSGTDSEEFSSNYDSSSREHEQHSSSRRSAFSGEFSNREVSP